MSYKTTCGSPSVPSLRKLPNGAESRSCQKLPKLLRQLVLDVLSSSSDDDEKVVQKEPTRRLNSLEHRAITKDSKETPSFQKRQPAFPPTPCTPHRETPEATAATPGKLCTPSGLRVLPQYRTTPANPAISPGRARRLISSSGRNRPFDWSDSSSSGDENPDGKADIERCALRVVQMKETARRDEDSWFLESLSEDAALEQCHPDAVLFRCRFKALRSQLVSRLFTIFNQELFAAKLQQPEIRWSKRLTRTAGMCHYREHGCSTVELSTRVCTCAEHTRDTLLHELCHAATWNLHGCRDGHGYAWNFWVQRARVRFPKLPAVERCHHYEL